MTVSPASDTLRAVARVVVERVALTVLGALPLLPLERRAAVVRCAVARVVVVRVVRRVPALVPFAPFSLDAALFERLTRRAVATLARSTPGVVWPTTSGKPSCAPRTNAPHW